MSSGDGFGELAIKYGVPRTASCRAVTKTYCALLKGESYMRIMS